MKNAVEIHSGALLSRKERNHVVCRQSSCQASKARSQRMASCVLSYMECGWEGNTEIKGTVRDVEERRVS